MSRRILHIALTLALLVALLVPSTRPYLLPSIGPFDTWWQNLSFDLAVLSTGALMAGIVVGRVQKKRAS